MTTLAEGSRHSPARLAASDAEAPRSGRRLFGGGMSVAIAMTVFVGFAPTYYMRSFFGGRELSILIHMHGLAFSAWVVLFAAQTLLVAVHRTALHRQLGVAGAVVAVAAVVISLTALFVSRADAWRAWFAVSPTIVATIAAVMVDNSGNVIMFGGFVAAAMYCRHRRPESHKRLMLLACLAVMNAPVARIIDGFGPWITPAAIAGLFDHGVANVMALPFFLALVLHDCRSLSKLHSATVWGGAVLFLLQPVCMFVVNHSDAIQAVRKSAGS